MSFSPTLAARTSVFSPERVLADGAVQLSDAMRLARTEHEADRERWARQLETMKTHYESELNDAQAQIETLEVTEAVETCHCLNTITVLCYQAELREQSDELIRERQSCKERMREMRQSWSKWDSDHADTTATKESLIEFDTIQEAMRSTQAESVEASISP